MGDYRLKITNDVKLAKRCLYNPQYKLNKQLNNK